MVQAEDYDNQQQQQQHHNHHRSASNLPNQQQLAALLQAAGPVVADSTSGCLVHPALGGKSLHLPLARRSSAGGAAAAVGSPSQPQPGTPTSDLMARTQIAAVQAAARVS